MRTLIFFFHLILAFYNSPQNEFANGRTLLSQKGLFAILMVLTLTLPFSSAAETKIFNHTVDQPFAGSQSPDDAFMSAMTKAKFEVLELAGTYLESLTVVENAILSRDEVTALAGGVLTAEVVKRENYANNKTFGIILTTKIEVDTDILHQRMDKLLQDRTLLRKYNEIQQREQELLARIKQLEDLNNNQSGKSSRPQHFSTEFSQISAALTASQWLEKAYSLWEHGRFSDPDQAIISLDQAIALDEKNPRAFNSRAVAYLNLEKFQDAENDLKKALQLSPSYADAFNNMGSLHYRMANYEEAIHAYTQALEIQPDFIQAILNRGLAYRKLFNFENAFEDFRRAMVLAPSTFTQEKEAGSLVELNDIEKLCEKSQTACRMNLCRSLDFLRQRGFCLKDYETQ